jgi:hypothetical protein
MGKAPVAAKAERGAWTMDLGGLNWGIMTIVAPLLLVAVIAWAALRNRSSRRRRDETERSTHELYREEDVAHRGENERVP